MVDLEFLIRESELVEKTEELESDSCVIWLHGLGADGHDFFDVVPMLELNPKLKIRFIFPHAPVQSVTANGGARMRAWYDIYGIGREFPDDKAGIVSSEVLIKQIINEQIAAGIDSSKIILAGFSQGGAVSLHTALRYEFKLAGVLALSTYLPLLSSFEQEASGANKTCPILMMHGTQDPVIALEFAIESKQKLVDLGYQLEWQTYDMPHSVCPEQCKRIGEWFNELLG